MSMFVGEALAGEGNEIAHIDLLIGSKDGPVGIAFANALARQSEGHSNLLAVLTPNLAVKPSTVLITKVTIKGAKQAVQMFGPAQAAVAKAVADSVEAGVIPKKNVEDLVIVCGVFIHWDAADDKKIYDFNYMATKEAISAAMQGKPSVEEVLAGKESAHHPFRGFSDRLQRAFTNERPMPDKRQLLSQPIEHIDITRHNVVPLVDSMRGMAFTARDLHRAAEIYDRMLGDPECGIILCLAGSLISAGLRRIFVDMIRFRMVDAIVSTGANIVDQDFFEALGFHHYIAPERFKAGLDDDQLRDLHIDRIYDTLIDEDELRACDDTTRQIADELPPRPHSSREFIHAMGVWLEPQSRGEGSIVRTALEHDVPIFCPAFSDCSAGFGLVAHQHARADQPKVSIDSVKDFYELTQLKIKSPATGLLMIGGGVPKNFAQDVVVAADVLGHDAPMHKYAVQITVADVRDGALSSSTLKEASSWGKVDTAFEQMVYSEATLALPLIAGYAYHRGAWKTRAERRWTRLLEPVAAQ